MTPSEFKKNPEKSTEKVWISFDGKSKPIFLLHLKKTVQSEMKKKRPFRRKAPFQEIIKLTQSKTGHIQSPSRNSLSCKRSCRSSRAHDCIFDL